MQGVRIRSEKAGRKFYKSRFGMIRIGQQCSRSGRACCSSVLIPFSLWIYTMNRCMSRLTLCAHVLALWGAAGSAFADTGFPVATDSTSSSQPYMRHRSFPDKAERGMIEFVEPPAIRVDGHDERLSPGSHVRGPRNRQLSARQLGGTGILYDALYVRDASGRIGDIWLLDREEAQQLSPRQKRDQALRMMGVDPTRRVRRDTPFDQLPTFDGTQ